VKMVQWICGFILKQRDKEGIVGVGTSQSDDYERLTEILWTCKCEDDTVWTKHCTMMEDTGSRKN